MDYYDNRVFAQFSRAIIEERDIVLKTPGNTSRCYCYVGDAASAIKTILENGENGTSYTVANEETYCSIHDMAKMLCDCYSNGKSKVVFDIDELSANGFAPEFKMKLDCTRIKTLGWNPKVGLKEMFARTINYMKQSK